MWVRRNKAFCAVALAALLMIQALQASADDGFVTVRDGRFVQGGKPFPVVGVNNHYLTFGSPAEVTRVLDDAVAMNATVVRTFIQPVIGSLDGLALPPIWDWKSRAEASNLGVGGVYMLYWDPASNEMGINDGADGLGRLDFLLDEARKRNLKLIVAFLDFWAYTGGAQQMRAWYGSDNQNTFFFSDPRTKQNYKDWIAHVLGRVNGINGIRYKDDPTIFAWELMNEADIRPASLRDIWLEEMSAYVKSIDAKHLLASGGANVTEKLPDIAVPGFDFSVWHGYPLYYNLSPVRFDALIKEMCALGRAYDKPVVLEEFGFARSNKDQPAVYRMWLDTLHNTRGCGGWLVWRLVSLQDSGRYPPDHHDQFDIHKDSGEVWNVLKDAAHRQRARTD